jgi:hypothetical protein
MMKTMRDLLYIVKEVSQRPETGIDEELQEFIAGLSGTSRAICYYDRFGLAWSQGFTQYQRTRACPGTHRRWASQAAWPEPTASNPHRPADQRQRPSSESSPLDIEPE